MSYSCRVSGLAVFFFLFFPFFPVSELLASSSSLIFIPFRLRPRGNGVGGQRAVYAERNELTGGGSQGAGGEGSRAKMQYYTGATNARTVKERGSRWDRESVRRRRRGQAGAGRRTHRHALPTSVLPSPRSPPHDRSPRDPSSCSLDPIPPPDHLVQHLHHRRSSARKQNELPPPPPPPSLSPRELEINYETNF